MKASKQNILFAFTVTMLLSIAVPFSSFADDVKGFAFAAQVTENVRQQNKSVKPQGEYVLADPTLARLRIHVPSEVLEKVLMAGRFLNQYESGDSGGGYDPAARWRLEQKISGLKFEKDKKNNAEFLSYLPKYTTVDLPDFSHDPRVLENWASEMKSDERLSQYGDVIVYLKDEVKKRATFTATDSGELVMPRAQSFNQERLHLDHKEVMRSDYFEAQVWGPLKVSDIDIVVLDPSSISQELGEMLVTKGIRVHLFSNAEAPFRMVSYHQQAADLSKPVGYYIPRDFLKRPQEMKIWFQGMTMAQVHTAIEMSLNLDPASASTVAGSLTSEQIEGITEELQKAGWNSEEKYQNLLKLAEFDGRIKNIFQKLATPEFLSQRSHEDLIKFTKLLKGTSAGKGLEKTLIAKFIGAMKGSQFDNRLASHLDLLAEMDSRVIDAFLDFVARNPSAVLQTNSDVKMALAKISLSSAQIDKVIEILAQDTYKHSVGALIAISAKNYANSAKLSMALQNLMKDQFNGNNDFSAKNILAAMETWPSIEQPLRDFLIGLINGNKVTPRLHSVFRTLLEKRPTVLRCDKIFIF